MGRVETRITGLVKQATHPANAAAVRLATTALGMARLCDAGNLDAGRQLRVVVRHLANCGPVENPLDGILARAAETMLEALRDAPPVHSSNGLER